jgi:hypothetical protein
MPDRSRLVVGVLVTLFLTLVLGLQSDFMSRVAAQQPIASPGDEAMRALYDNSTQFEQLSSAAQSLLELKFGRKGPPARPQAPAAGEPDALAPLANPVVNAADTSAQDTQSDTSIVLGAGANVIAAFTDSGSFGAPTFNHFTGFSRSTNAGSNWSDGGALPDSVNGDSGDPVLARDNTSGKTYLATLMSSGSGLQVFNSANDGSTWSVPVNAGPGFGSGDLLDKPWIAVDNAPGAGQGNVYVLFRNFRGAPGLQPSGIYFTKSTDQGATFGPNPGTLIFGGGQGAFIAVGPDHAIYAFYFSSGIFVRKSTDFGATFSPAVTISLLTGTGVNGDLGLGGGFRTNSFPHAAVNPVNGNIYVTWNAPSGPDKGDILAAVSNNGATWSLPFTINDDWPYLMNKDQWMPTLAVTPDGKHGLFTWYDRRSDPSNSLIERWGQIVTFTAGLIAHGPNFRISTGSFPVVIDQDPAVNTTYMGDYDQVAADNNYFYTTWGDNRLANPAIPSHAHQPDVRFARIPVTGPPFGDVDRDLQTDRTVFRPSNNGWYSALSNGGGTFTVWGTPGDIDVMADYDGDGKGDIAVFRPSTGTWWIVLSSNGAVVSTTWGTTGDIPIPGDWDGDGKADLIVWRPSTGVWYVRQSTGGAASMTWGTTNDLPLVADFDGDGRSDLAVFRPSTGTWFVAYWAGGSASFAWGTAGDVPVAGDFDGDGKADFTVFRPGTGVWYSFPSAGGPLAVTWGTSGDFPVRGDMDGDGKSDFTVWRPSNGTWYTQFRAGGAAVAPWGTTGDKPTGRQPGT